MPVELGWGTHEKALPPDAGEHDQGPGNAIYLRRPGGQTLLRSWVPLGGPILGLALPHNESITLSDYLTLEQDGQVVYRPTVVMYQPAKVYYAPVPTVYRPPTKTVVYYGDPLCYPRKTVYYSPGGYYAPAPVMVVPATPAVIYPGW